MDYNQPWRGAHDFVSRDIWVMITGKTSEHRTPSVQMVLSYKRCNPSSTMKQQHHEASVLVITRDKTVPIFRCSSDNNKIALPSSLKIMEIL